MVSRYTGQAVCLVRQAEASDKKTRPTPPRNTPTIEQVARLYEAGHKTALADWVRHNYTDPATQAEVQDVLEIAVCDKMCSLSDALHYIDTYLPPEA